MKRVVFEQPLREGVILRRRGPLALEAEADGRGVLCHFAARGRLGGVELAGRPCLIAPNGGAGRRTQARAEAFALEVPEAEKKRWIGIDRFLAARCVAHYAARREFSDMMDTSLPAARGRFLADMRTDFRLGGTYLKLQTPMETINLPGLGTPDGHTKEPPPWPRVIRQLLSVADALQPGQRLILLLCYLYDSGATVLCARSDPRYAEIRDAVRALSRRGVFIWQANFRVMPEYAVLLRHYPIGPEAVGGPAPGGEDQPMGRVSTTS